MKQVVSGRKDVVFMLKMLPLVQIHPEAYKKSQVVVCALGESNEKALALLEDAYAKKPLPEPSCQTDAIDKALELGREIGLTGTPAMFFPDGRKIPGAKSAAELNKIIDMYVK
jgi:thiol:disulfide interchange protein DsbC